MTTLPLTSIANPAFLDVITHAEKRNNYTFNDDNAALFHGLQIHRGLKNKGTGVRAFSFYSPMAFAKIRELGAELAVRCFEFGDHKVDLPENFSGKLFEAYRIVYYTEDEIVMMISLRREMYRGDAIRIDFHGDRALVHAMFEACLAKFYAVGPRIFNVGIKNHGLNRKLLDVDLEKDALDVPAVNYPYLPETPQDLMAQFLASDQNVLVMIGPPGTGKSTYTREMIHSVFRDRLPGLTYDDEDKVPSVHLLSDTKVLQHEELLDYLQDQVKPSREVIFVFEDADHLIGRRTDGNAVMSGLLNLSDGIVKTNIKIIISTNLASVDKVDEALIRPGRCFGVVSFNRLNLEQAQAVRDHYGLEPIEGKGPFSLAEVLNYRPVRHAAVPTFGFRA